MSENLILMPFQDLPFNGDIFIMKRFADLKKKYNLNTAIETGSCLFSTTKFLSELFDKVYTCEINETYYNAGVHKVNLEKVTALRKDSVEALKEIIPALPDDARCIFFLDAHWGDHCPLLEELAEIAKIKTKEPPIIVIHDFQVPEHPELGFDSYQGKVFNVEFTAPSIYAIEVALNTEYTTTYNSEAAGAMRGIVYFLPKQQQLELKAADVMEGLKEQATTAPMGLVGEEIENVPTGTVADAAAPEIVSNDLQTIMNEAKKDPVTGDRELVDFAAKLSLQTGGGMIEEPAFNTDAIAPESTAKDIFIDESPMHKQQAEGRRWRQGEKKVEVIFLDGSREIEFNALFTAGENEEIKAIIPGVVFVRQGIVAKSVKAFNEAIKSTGYQFDGKEVFIKEGAGVEAWIPVGDMFLTDEDGNVYFNGKPLQYTGFKDKEGKKLFESQQIFHSTYGKGQIIWDAHVGMWAIRWKEFDGTFRSELYAYKDVLKIVDEI